MLEDYLRNVVQVSDAFVFEPIIYLEEYCDTVFSDKIYAESKILCYEQVEEPMGPEKCFLLPRVYDDILYHYNYFYKYLCLYNDYVELEEEAHECLDVNNIDDLLIKERDDCLKELERYVEPVLTLDSRLWFYYKPVYQEDDLDDLTRINDEETDVTLE